MKKLLAALAITFTAGIFNVQAQTVELIPKAGINLGKQAINQLTGEKSKLGFQGGLGFNIQAGNSGFSVQPEINFISKGVAFKTANNKKQNYNINYLEVPLLAKYSFGPVYVNAGPSLGLRLGESKLVNANYGELKKIDFGVQMGAGVAIPAGPGKFIIDGRYALGLRNISKVKGSEIKNRGLIASIGYAIPLGK